MTQTYRARTRLARLAAAAALLLLAGCNLLRPVPDDLDLASSRSSEKGLYRATITPPAGGIPLHRIHSWTLRLEDRAGAPLSAARVGVDGDMPQHLHGLPTRPEVRADSLPGRYRVDGLKFHMTGWWTVTFAVDGPQGPDTVTFNLML